MSLPERNSYLVPSIEIKRSFLRRLILLFGLVILFAPLPARAESQPSELKSTASNQSKPAAFPAKPKSYSIRISIHATRPVAGEPSVESMNVELTPKKISLYIPSFSIEENKEASSLMRFPRLDPNSLKQRVSYEESPGIFAKAKLTRTFNGELNLDLRLITDNGKVFDYDFSSLRSPINLESEQQKIIPLNGSPEDPIQWIEISLSQLGPATFLIRHKFNVENHDTQAASSTGGETTLSLDGHAISFMSVNSIPVDDGAPPDMSVAFFAKRHDENTIAVTGEVFVKEQEDKLIISPRNALLCPCGKFTSHVLRRDSQNRPTLWLDLEIEAVSP